MDDQDKMAVGKARGPPPVETPLELLTDKGYIEPPFVNQYWGPVLGGTLGFITICAANYFVRRPLMAGIQNHVFFTAGLAYLGKFVDERRSGYLAERDAVFRHYIQLHPDDFPPYERKKYADVLEPWYPIR